MEVPKELAEMRLLLHLKGMWKEIQQYRVKDHGVLFSPQNKKTTMVLLY